MTKLQVYDIEANEIENIAEDNDTTTAEVMQAIMDAIKNERINIKEYL